MPWKTCPECGEQFSYKASQPRRECCSRSCAQRLRNRRLMATGSLYLPTKPQRGNILPCATCGEPVYRNKSQVAKAAQRFCSTRCWNTAQTQPPVLKSCLTCGKELRLKPSQAAREHCSTACAAVTATKRPLTEQYNGRAVKLDPQGYRMVWQPDHPNRLYKGWQYEHRIVAEQQVGRYLGRDEHVHHVNGDKADNRPENLVIMDGNDHAALSSREYREQLERERAELAEYRRRFGPLSSE